MTNNSESDIKLVPYKELARKKALDYYYANREVIMEKNRNRYSALSPEEKKKRYESNRQWYNNHLKKKAKMKEKQKKYNKSKYHNLMVKIH